MAASVKKPRGEVGSRYVENLPLRGDHWTVELLDVHGQFAMSALRRLRPVDVEDFLCRNLYHHHPCNLRIESANPVAANDKVGRIENMALDEVQHGSINVGPLRLH
jgi:hypothetical protein